MREAPIAKCCDCGRIRSGSHWQPEPNPQDSLVLYSHTYCPVCLQKAMMEIEQLSDKAGLELLKAG